MICPVAAVAALVVASWLAAVLVLPSYHVAAVVDPAVLGPVPVVSRSSLVVAVLQSCRVAAAGDPAVLGSVPVASWSSLVAVVLQSCRAAAVVDPAVPLPAAVGLVLRACLASAVPA